MAGGVKQKRSRSASGVNHSLVQRICNRVLTHAISEPIWSVELAQLVPLCWINETFVQALQNVGFYIPQLKAAYVTSNFNDKCLSARFKKYPIKKITLHNSDNSSITKRPTLQKVKPF